MRDAQKWPESAVWRGVPHLPLTYGAQGGDITYASLNISSIMPRASQAYLWSEDVEDVPGITQPFMDRLLSHLSTGNSLQPLTHNDPHPDPTQEHSGDQSSSEIGPTAFA
jgi:hypothetical protein